MEDTGFDAVDAGSLSDSWWQQPGDPAYCTELNLQHLPAALAAAEKDLLRERRDKAMAIGKRAEAGESLNLDDLVGNLSSQGRGPDVERATQVKTDAPNTISTAKGIIMAGRLEPGQ